MADRSEDLPDGMDEEIENPILPGDEDGGNDEEARLDAMARAQGWVPEEEWDAERAEREGRRRPARFMTAREFLERTQGSMPMMRDRNNKMAAELAGLKQQVSEMHQVITEQRKMTIEASKRAFEQGIAKAKEDMRRAAEEGDTAAFDKAQAAYEGMIKQPTIEPEPPPQRPAEPDIHPETLQWVNANPWFNANPTLQRAMIDEHKAIMQRSPDLSQYDSLEAAAGMVKRRYPEYFRMDNPPARRTSAVSQPTGGRQSGAPGNKTRLSDLPKADQEAYARHRDMFKKNGVDYTEAEFIEEYHAQR